MEPLCIRPATGQDASALARVFAAAIEDKAREAYGPRERAAWVARGTKERFAAMLADTRNTILAALCGGTICGMVSLTGFEVSLLYAAPTAPSGTGATLLAAIEALARERGIAGLQLCASRNALSFYLRHGYGIVSAARRPLADGIALSVCLMAKTLEA
ncbi:GNAT family N-acetyltransferase [Desulfovibrio sp. TomC]|uniref:GNAT family N-acetyltransferase n=1 Tax=Desulfovibrio sp. TomC TaxID=1562888 RepID=UPI0005757371|nr:GNAT family N-acetyltransferase [Desulfovibrio sp. TomC]KHK01312.1 Ribosomal-protein-S18p-alanine acetyltransferase [Desulfovibrio sp. TomC]